MFADDAAVKAILDASDEDAIFRAVSAEERRLEPEASAARR
jgi:hypothetical protein